MSRQANDRGLSLNAWATSRALFSAIIKPRKDLAGVATAIAGSRVEGKQAAVGLAVCRRERRDIRSMRFFGGLPKEHWDMKKLGLALFGALSALAASPAFAGEWRLDASRCPDLVEDRYDRHEDRRDGRRDYGWRDRIEDRRDRRENRRDEAITVCPRRAFYYAFDNGRRGAWDYRLDADSRGRYDDRGRSYGKGRRGHERRRIPDLKLRYDRRVGLPYTYDRGRRIYVRG